MFLDWLKMHIFFSVHQCISWECLHMADPSLDPLVAGGSECWQSSTANTTALDFMAATRD